MEIAVELFFDSAGDKMIRKLWRKMSQAGISSFMEDMGSTPHISIAVYDAIDLDLLRKKAADFAQHIPPLSLKLSALGIFPGPGGVLFLAPAVTEELLDLHSLYHRFTAEWADLVWPHYRPGVWFPHCTLAMALKDRDLPQALQLVRENFAGLEITVRSAAIVRYSPAEVLQEFPLGRP